jgi:hypothetical protein|tara:strand:- start:151 stop:333 length:183 start_codon:yes stop_codon:yes gene_type:complete
MSQKKSKLNQIIDTLCEGKDENYKAFIKKMMLSMNEGDRWEKLSELNILTEKLKNKKPQK